MKFTEYVKDMTDRYDAYYFYPDCPIRELMIKPVVRLDMNMQFEDGIDYNLLHSFIQWAYAMEDSDSGDYETFDAWQVRQAIYREEKERLREAVGTL